VLLYPYPLAYAVVTVNVLENLHFFYEHVDNNLVYVIIQHFVTRQRFRSTSVSTSNSLLTKESVKCHFAKLQTEVTSLK